MYPLSYILTILSREYCGNVAPPIDQGFSTLQRHLSIDIDIHQILTEVEKDINLSIDIGIETFHSQ
jgi:hypothetical protein